MSLSHGKRYMSALDGGKDNTVTVADILNIPSQAHVVSIAETAQEPESVQHHASLAAVPTGQNP